MTNNAFIPAQTFSAVDTCQPAFDTLVIPEFDIENANATPTILQTCALGNTEAFTIRLPLDSAVEENETFALCVSFTINSETVRYAIHKPIWVDGILYPAYSGQSIGASATLEIWGVLEDTNAAADEFTLTIGPMTLLPEDSAQVIQEITGTETTLTFS